MPTIAGFSALSASGDVGHAMVGRLHLLKLGPVSERIRRVKPEHSLTLVVGADAAETHRLERGLERVEIVHDERGVALRAGWKSASTPMWSSTSPARNQQPPRVARAGGLGSSFIWSTSP